jgi:hypothetical protein
MYEPATTIKEAKALFKTGFIHECEIGGVRLFKKLN